MQAFITGVHTASRGLKKGPKAESYNMASGVRKFLLLVEDLYGPETFDEAPFSTVARFCPDESNALSHPWFQGKSCSWLRANLGLTPLHLSFWACFAQSKAEVDVFLGVSPLDVLYALDRLPQFFHVPQRPD